jgi:uncharacterized protein
MKIAVIGSGIAGLSCAYRLVGQGEEVTLLEAGDYFGGHTHTVDVSLEGVTHGLDTGFLVFNRSTYPALTGLFEELGVATEPSEMSFSVKLPVGDGPGARCLEWAGGNLNAVFAQRRNVFNPRFLRMLRDILRFNGQANAMILAGDTPDIALGDFLRQQRYSEQFCNWYLLPMAACIWSCPSDQMLAFPLASFLSFCHNHGLLQINDRPQWRTVQGGARRYVEKMVEAIADRRLNCPVLAVTRSVQRGVRMVKLETGAGSEYFDHVVMACHSDQALALLTDARQHERDVLAAIRYQPNLAVLHTDARCLPASPKAWSAWNYQSAGGAGARVCVHYLLNRLQRLPFAAPVIVSLNPIEAPDPSCVIGQYAYAHPVFDAGALAAQASLAACQGREHTWFAGAWAGYGFHEDGLKSGLAVAAALAQLKWEQAHVAA